MQVWRTSGGLFPLFWPSAGAHESERENNVSQSMPVGMHFFVGGGNMHRGNIPIYFFFLLKLVDGVVEVVFCWYSRIFTGGRFDRSGWKGGCRVYLGNCQYPAIPDPYCDTPMIPDNDWLVFVKTPTAYKQGPAVIRHFIPIDLNPWQFHYICQFKCDKVTCVCDLDFLLLL